MGLRGQGRGARVPTFQESADKVLALHSASWKVNKKIEHTCLPIDLKFPERCLVVW